MDLSNCCTARSQAHIDLMAKGKRQKTAGEMDCGLAKSLPFHPLHFDYSGIQFLNQSCATYESDMYFHVFS